MLSRNCNYPALESDACIVLYYDIKDSFNPLFVIVHVSIVSSISAGMLPLLLGFQN